MSILIIEDFVPQQGLLQKMVAGSNFDCEIAGTGDEALAALKKNKGNLVWILDWYFPCEKKQSPVYDPEVVRNWIRKIDINLADRNIEWTNETAMWSVLVRLASTLGYILPNTIILNSAEIVANEDMLNSLLSLGYNGQIVERGPIKSDAAKIKWTLLQLQ